MNRFVKYALIGIVLLALVGGSIFYIKQGDTPVVTDDPSGELAAEEVQDPSYDAEVEGKDDPTTKDYDNGIVFEEEGEDAVIEAKPSPGDAFIGTWEATSGQAAYLYGGIEITVNKDKTWDAVITDEPLHGKWKEKGDGLYLTSEYLNLTLYFSSSGSLLMEEEYEDIDEDPAIIVLTKKQ